MRIPLQIGRNSSGELYTIDLQALPNLFLSYSEDNQLVNVLQQLIDGISIAPEQSLIVTCFHKQTTEHLLPIASENNSSGNFYAYSDNNKHRTVDNLIQTVTKELNLRKRLVAANKLNILKRPSIVVLIDDIFEVITCKHKKTPLSFIELLLDGSLFGIHFIACSSGIYQNLLDQLVTVSPAMKKRMLKGKHSAGIREPLAARMIINPDGLVFFKSRMGSEYVLLYAK